jgi:hypothetical protein
MDKAELSHPAGRARTPTPVELAATARRTEALLRTVAQDFLLREQFVTDPVQVTSEYVAGSRVAPERAVAANTFVYSVLSNPRLVAWLRESSLDRRHSAAPDDEFLADFAAAIAGADDRYVVGALMRGAQSSERVLDVEVSLLRELFRLGAFTDDDGTGTEFSPGTGTEFSPGTGTEFSPGTGTEMSPGTGTEMSPGTGTEMSPGTGTEMSPGTGTEMSPGTGTEMSGWGGRFGEVILQALVEYATELRSAGALELVLEESPGRTFAR